MSSIERITVTLPAGMAASVKAAVAGGDYASTSEVIREALRDWEAKTELRRRKLDALRRDIGEGLDDIAAGRTRTASLDDIMARARLLSSRSEPSA